MRAWGLILILFLFVGCIGLQESKAVYPVGGAVDTQPPTTTPPLTSSPNISRIPVGAVYGIDARVVTTPPAYTLPPAKLLDIPLYRQEDEDWCGQAAVQMVLAYYGINKTQKQIASEMDKFGKTYPNDLLMYLKKQGLNAFVSEIEHYRNLTPYLGEYPVILEYIEYDYQPPLGGDSFDIDHWMILKGRDEDGAYLWLDSRRSGEIGWMPTKNYTVIIVEGFQQSP